MDALPKHCRPKDSCHVGMTTPVEEVVVEAGWVHGALTLLTCDLNQSALIYDKEEAHANLEYLSAQKHTHIVRVYFVTDRSSTGFIFDIFMAKTS